MATFDDLVSKLENLSFEFTNFDKITDTLINQTDIYKSIRITLEDVFEGDFSQSEIRQIKDFINQFVDNGFAIIFQSDQSSLSTLLKEDTVGDKGAVKQINRNSIPISYDMDNPTVEYVYLPDDINIQKQKFLTTYKENLKNISGGLIDDINLQPLYPGGPLFTKSAKDAENLKIVFKDLFKNFRDQKLYYPFAHMLDTPFNKYQLQLSYYQLMLEQVGIPISKRLLLWLHDDATYDVYQMDDMTKEIEKELNSFSHQGLNE